MTKNNICPNCFKQTGGATVCPHCGHDQAKDRKYAGVLPTFTALNGRYIIGRVLGRGGFGITYIALDAKQKKRCAVKEYMPTEYASRREDTLEVIPNSDDKAKYVFAHGREKFIEEAKTLIQLRNNPNVVDIIDFFKQNNTGYLVMEYLDGENLREMARSSGGTLPPDFAQMVFLTLASALMEVHRLNILHRDISPENIVFTRDGRVKLIDFGAARNFVSTQNKGMSILLKPGFAPPEQYEKKGEHGPWCDVYALCATYYTLVSGKPLVDALFRYRGQEQPSLYSMGCPVSKRMSDVIDKGMELDYRRRYQNFKDLMDDVDVGGKPQPAPRRQTPQPVRQPAPQPAPQKQAPQPVPQKQTPQPVSQRGAAVLPQTQPSAPPAAAERKFYIAALVGGNLCNKVQLGTQDIFKIGRSNISCQYIISGDTNVSRIHCYLRMRAGRMYLVDTSSNGTFFGDGRKLVKNKEYLIEPGATFYLATRNHMLKFIEEKK